MPNSWTKIPGTERTGEYLAVARALTEGRPRGDKVGIRFLSYMGGGIRVRVEPRNQANSEAMAELMSRSGGWKQPGDGGQNRFSIVVHSAEGTLSAVDTALEALRSVGDKLQYNPDRGQYRKQIRAHFA